MAAMNLFGRLVDSDDVEVVLEVASPRTQRAVQAFLDDGTQLPDVARHELDGLLSGYVPQSAN